MNQSFFKSPAFWYGIYYGIAGILFFVLIYAINFEFFGHFFTFMAIGMALMVTFMITGGIAQRKYNGGYLKYGKAFVSLLSIGLIGGLVNMLFSIIFVNFIDPDFTKNLAEVMKESVMNFMQSFEQISDEDIDKALADMDKEFARSNTPLFYLKQIFTRDLPGALFFSLICSLFVKRNPPLYLTETPIAETES